MLQSNRFFQTIDLTTQRKSSDIKNKEPKQHNWGGGFKYFFLNFDTYAYVGKNPMVTNMFQFG